MYYCYVKVYTDVCLLVVWTWPEGGHRKPKAVHRRAAQRWQQHHRSPDGNQQRRLAVRHEVSAKLVRL